MDRWRAAGALLALAACIATTVAAPTSTNNHTALDLYDENSEGCYYNFQHYGEGDRIMTNEPCLNCTCHNRMLMCYLRVCPFTKAIGQDCTVEKRADQCCPIVTCPDVPVDLLTSTSTTSPAEYGGTGVGKVDNYGCTINGRYFSEGSKVPQTPGKPCEHCYCIRNMTTCVMQECTLHVDGCTPIYHKDVCCPVRYFCDHPEDEMPLLDDMTTTVRPTPGFLLTTTPASDIPTTTVPPRRDCIEGDQLYPDGALIKTAKPCEHCYCMKGDIVCVVQECGTPMENEGKNCTSLPPREGQCCPDTYICEGDELSIEPTTTELPFEELTTATPPRRVSVEGSGYRNEPDEVPYTDAPTFSPDVEGSGEDELEQKPLDTSDKLKPEIEPTEQVLEDKYGATEEGEFIAKSTESSVLEDVEKKITDSDKESNTTPGEISVSYSTTEAVIQDKTTKADEPKPTEHSFVPKEEDEGASRPEESSEPFVFEGTTVISDSKTTDSPLAMDEITTESDKFEKGDLGVTTQDKDKQTESAIVKDVTTEVLPVETLDAAVTKPIVSEDSATVKESEHKDNEQNTVPSLEITTQGLIEEMITQTSPTVDLPIGEDTRRKPSHDDNNEKEQPTSPKAVEEETSTPFKYLQENEKETTESALMSDLNTVPVDTDEVQTTEPFILDITTTREDTKSSDLPGFIEDGTTSRIPDEKTSEPSTEKSTASEEFTIESQEQKTTIPALQEKDQEDQIATTEPAFRKEDEGTETLETMTPKDTRLPTTIPEFTPSLEPTKSDEQPDKQPIPTTTPVFEQQEDDKAKLPSQASEEELHQTKPPTTDERLETVTDVRESTTESIMELSTFAHVDDKESSATTTFAPDKTELSETTVNPEDNEIAEVPSPGRIPGEGDCLLEGRTYKNESVVPSSNKCYTSCKCLSSIIKCDPIICSPPPEYMDNCQPTYDTPESCCPTYICDHGKETIPPQPHSQMSGTESPTSSPAIECNGDQCEIINKQTLPEIPSLVPDKQGVSDCGKEGCEVSDQKPIIPERPEYPDECTDGKCASPAEAEIMPPKEIIPVVTPDTSSQDVPLSSCDGNNEDDKCKIQHVIPTDHIPATPCEGNNCDSATEHVPATPCEGDNCQIKPETPAEHVPPTLCEGDNCEIKHETPTEHVPAVTCEEDNCQIKPGTPAEPVSPTRCEGDDCVIMPETPSEHIPASPCEGDNCYTKPETPAEHAPATPCEGDNCDVKPETPTQDVPCKGENCKIKPETPTEQIPATPCVGDNCDIKHETSTEHLPAATCEGDNCKIKPETEQVPPSRCEGDNCEIRPETPTQHVPAAPCEGDNCEIKPATPKDHEPATPCEGDNCDIKPEIHSEHLPVIPCEGDNCDVKAETPTQHVPTAPCEGDSCEIKPETPAEQVPAAPCEGDKCQIKPETPAEHIPATPCEGDNCDVKPEMAIQHVPDAPCEGDNCEIKPDTPAEHVPTTPCEGDKCQIKPETPTEHIPVAPCESDNCEVESATPAEHVPVTPCDGDSCVGKPETPTQHVPVAPCEGDNCKIKPATPTDHVPATPCEGDNCEIRPEMPTELAPAIPCEDNNCRIIPEIPKETEMSQSPAVTCDSDNCEIKPQIPTLHVSETPCEGDECETKHEIPAEQVPTVTCDGDNCEIKPDISTHVIPEICENQDECKQVKIPETNVPTEISIPDLSEFNKFNDTRKHEPAVSDEEQKATKAPEEFVTELTTTAFVEKQEQTEPEDPHIDILSTTQTVIDMEFSSQPPTERIPEEAVTTVPEDAKEEPEAQGEIESKPAEEHSIGTTESTDIVVSTETVKEAEKTKPETVTSKPEVSDEQTSESSEDLITKLSVTTEETDSKVTEPTFTQEIDSKVPETSEIPEEPITEGFTSSNVRDTTKKTSPEEDKPTESPVTHVTEAVSAGFKEDITEQVPETSERIDEGIIGTTQSTQVTEPSVSTIPDMYKLEDKEPGSDESIQDSTKQPEELDNKLQPGESETEFTSSVDNVTPIVTEATPALPAEVAATSDLDKETTAEHDKFSTELPIIESETKRPETKPTTSSELEKPETIEFEPDTPAPGLESVDNNEVSEPTMETKKPVAFEQTTLPSDIDTPTQTTLDKEQQTEKPTSSVTESQKPFSYDTTEKDSADHISTEEDVTEVVVTKVPATEIGFEYSTQLPVEGDSKVPESEPSLPHIPETETPVLEESATSIPETETSKIQIAGEERLTEPPLSLVTETAEERSSTTVKTPELDIDTHISYSTPPTTVHETTSVPSLMISESTEAHTIKQVTESEQEQAATHPGTPSYTEALPTTEKVEASSKTSIEIESPATEHHYMQSDEVTTNVPLISDSQPEMTSEATSTGEYEMSTDEPKKPVEDIHLPSKETEIQQETTKLPEKEFESETEEPMQPEVTKPDLDIRDESATTSPQLLPHDKTTLILEYGEDKTTETSEITLDEKSTESPMEEKTTKVPERPVDEKITETYVPHTEEPITELQHVVTEKDKEEDATILPDTGAELSTEAPETKLPEISRTRLPESSTEPQKLGTDSSVDENIATKAPLEEQTESHDKELTTTKVPEIAVADKEIDSPVESSTIQQELSSSTIKEVTESQETHTDFEVSPTEPSTVLVVSEDAEPPSQVTTESSESGVEKEQEPVQTSKPELEYSETTPFLVELEEHTHKLDDEISTELPFVEPTTLRETDSEETQTVVETHMRPEKTPEEAQTERPVEVDDQKTEKPDVVEEPQTTESSTQIPEKSTEIEAIPDKEVAPEGTTSVPSTAMLDTEHDKQKDSALPGQTFDLESTPIAIETEKPEQTDKEVTAKPQEIPETTAPEEEFIAVTTKSTTRRAEEETTTPPVQMDKFTRPEDKPYEVSSTTVLPEVSKPEELQPTDEIPSPEDDSHFPPTGGYNQEPDYVEEDQAFGPGTCRYGGKVYVSAQQIPRDDPCDFCFCFRSDIICLQQSCPPPIHGCHEEPIQGFCCPRYECPVSMATTLNVTTTTTTTTTTLPPHFLPHAYKGAAQRRGCQIKGHTYKVGEVVRASSGPCLHCTCGGDGQMKCDPKACTPEPMLRQMIAAAVSAKRRR